MKHDLENFEENRKVKNVVQKKTKSKRTKKAKKAKKEKLRDGDDGSSIVISKKQEKK